MISDQKDRMIKSMKELKEYCNNGYTEFYVLSGGILRGSRDIYYNEENKSCMFGILFVMLKQNIKMMKNL